jgi:hypothetical protein
MRKFTIVAVAVLAIAGSTAVYAQYHHPWMQHMRISPEDRAAFVDARIAAVHAGLKLTAGRVGGKGLCQAADRSRQCVDEGARRRAGSAEAG